MDLFQRVYDIVTAALAPSEDDDEDAMDVDGESGKGTRELRQQLVVSGVKALSQSFRPNLRAPNDDDASQHLAKLLTSLESLVPAPGTNIELKTCSVEAIVLVVGRIQGDAAAAKGVSTEALKRVWTRILAHAGDRGFEAGRIKAVEGMDAFVSVVSKRGDKELVKAVKADVDGLRKAESSPMVLRVLDPVGVRLELLA